MGGDFRPGPQRSNWKGDTAPATTKRRRAQRRYKDIGVCEVCVGKPATDRHHIDGDTGNNKRANLAFLCRRCHMEMDGRLAALDVHRSENSVKGGRATRKLDEETVIAIRQSIGLISGEEWTRRLGIARATVSRIRNGLSYQEIGGRRKGDRYA